jgi:hypothetical protein
MSQFTRQQFISAQFRQRSPSGFCFIRATRQQLRVAIIQVLSEFFDDCRLAHWRKFQRRQPFSNLFFPIRHTRPKNVLRHSAPNKSRLSFRDKEKAPLAAAPKKSRLLLTT